MLKSLGNPNKEYYKEDSLFLNYLELGLDIMVSKSFEVKKFILHTNFPEHPHFGFHNRCNFELQIVAPVSDIIKPKPKIQKKPQKAQANLNEEEEKTMIATSAFGFGLEESQANINAMD